MGRTGKSEFRADWAKKEWKKYDEKRTIEVEMSETDSKIGTMLNYDAILKLEGGRKSPAAVEGTNNIVRSCLERGVGWVSIDPYSKRMMFRHVRSEMRQERSDRWKTIQEERPPAALQDEPARTPEPKLGLGMLETPPNVSRPRANDPDLAFMSGCGLQAPPHAPAAAPAAAASGAAAAPAAAAGAPPAPAAPAVMPKAALSMPPAGAPPPAAAAVLQAPWTRREAEGGGGRMRGRKDIDNANSLNSLVR